MNSDLLISFGRMFPDFSVPSLDETSPAFSLSWSGSGIVEHGQVLMLSGLVLHSADAAFSVCSLSSILEPHAAPKYYLSPAACSGILRRAKKRGRELPEHLLAALEAVAATASQTAVTAEK